jgi:Sulfotransferase family
MTLRRLSKRPGAVPAHFDSDSFVSQRLGFVYQCVPKTISRAMLQYLALVDPDGFRVYERRASIEVLCGNGAHTTSFTFVRNPYSRAVAVYYDKFINYRETRGQRALFARHPGIRPDMTFIEFVEWLITDDGSDQSADPHFLSQHYFVLGADGEAALDYLGKVETVDADLAQLQDVLGLERRPLPRVNSNATRDLAYDSSRLWEEVLDDRTRRLLAVRYDGDFEALEYPRLPFKALPRYPRPPGGPPRTERAAESRRRSFRSRAGAVVNRALKKLGVEVRNIRPQA